jgi:hypothetical protein
MPFYADEWQPDFGQKWPRYTREQLDAMTDDEMRERLRAKLLCEQNAKIDPLQFGWTLEGWREVMECWKTHKVHCILGGNRSSKSSFAASLVLHAAMSIPEAKIRCYHVNDEKSIAEQQAMVWAALPERFKALGRKKGTNFSIQYSQKNGFTGKKLILPPMPGCTRGSEILFCNYQQYKNDPQTAEGWWAHLIWGDEEMPQKLFETLLYRLVDVRGRLLLTFTTLNGWSPLIQDILGRVKTLRTIKSPVLKRQVPVAQESLSRPNTRIYYFQTADNPFVPAKDFLADLKGRPEAEVLARAHGIPTKTTQSPLPGFDELVHVVKHEDLPWMKERVHPKTGKVLPEPHLTPYHVVDPAGDKPWFMAWGAADARGAIWIYREWPDIEYGAWAEPGNSPEGKPGPAQRSCDMGYDDYKDVILNSEREDGFEPHERIMDPRLGNTTVQGADGATSIISQMDERGIIFMPAPGLNIQHGLSLINDRLSYNREEPLSPSNAPRLFISDRCQNLIYCLKNYTNSGKQDEPTKDGVDVLRYLLEHGADYVPNLSDADGGRTFSY